MTFRSSFDGKKYSWKSWVPMDLRGRCDFCMFQILTWETISVVKPNLFHNRYISKSIMIRSETFCRFLPAWHTIFATFWFVTSALLHLWHCALGYPGIKKIIKLKSIFKSGYSFFPIVFARKFKLNLHLR